jgi:hypothetical protein
MAPTTEYKVIRDSFEKINERLATHIPSGWKPIAMTVSQGFTLWGTSGPTIVYVMLEHTPAS